jgi:hypothetical protein
MQQAAARASLQKARMPLLYLPKFVVSCVTATVCDCMASTRFASTAGRSAVWLLIVVWCHFETGGGGGGTLCHVRNLLRHAVYSWCMLSYFIKGDSVYSSCLRKGLSCRIKDAAALLIVQDRRCDPLSVWCLKVATGRVVRLAHGGQQVDPVPNV